MPIRSRIALGAALAIIWLTTAAADGISTPAGVPSLGGTDGIGGGMGGASGVIGSIVPASGPPPSCTADGKTDWSNACDIPMGVALGVL